MLKNKAAVYEAKMQDKLPNYLSFYKESKTEPVRHTLKAYKTGEYDIEGEEDELAAVLKFLITGN